MARRDLTGIVTWTVRNTDLTDEQVIAGILSAAPGTQIVGGELTAWNAAQEAAADRWSDAQAAAHKAAATTIDDTPIPEGYRYRTSSLYGEGRFHSSTPGATQYRGADGSYSVQIWDQS